VCFAKHTLDLNQIGPEFFWVDLTQPAWRGWTQSAQPGHWPKPVTRLGTVGKRHAWIKSRVCLSTTIQLLQKQKKNKKRRYLPGLIRGEAGVWRIWWFSSSSFGAFGFSFCFLTTFLSFQALPFVSVFSSSRSSWIVLDFFLLVLGSPVSVSGFLPLLLVLFFRRSSFVVLPSLFRSSSMSSSNFSLFFQLLCCSAPHFFSFLWIL